MIEFNPVRSYQIHHKEEMTALLEQRTARWLTIGLSTAMSQLAAFGASEHELRGARRFVEIFLNLPETTDTIARYPERTLSSFDQGTSIKPEPKK